MVVSQRCELGAFHSATCQRVLQNTQVHALRTSICTEFRQSTNLDATVLGDDDRLRGCYFRANFFDDDLFVIQIKTHGQSP
jgi:hypothetical protein